MAQAIYFLDPFTMEVCRSLRYVAFELAEDYGRGHLNIDVDAAIAALDGSL